MATAAQIQRAMESLDLDQVADHFLHGESDDDVEDVEPFLVCADVSVDAFNEYVADKDDLPIGVRFLEIGADGRLLVNDLSAEVHESTTCEFQYAFLEASGNGREIKKCGSLTTYRHGLPAKEADATFGPYYDTPNRTAPPASVPFPAWVTLAVEVGRYQSWQSLTRAAHWWHGYAGIQYVLLIKVSARAQSLAYRLYDVGRHPLGPRSVLSRPPAQTGTLVRQQSGGPPEIIKLKAHRILSIPPGLPLPSGVNSVIAVDLREVMTRVIRALGPLDDQQ